MITSLASQIDIDAPPQRVWQELTQLADYTHCNPFILRAEGRIEVGAELLLHMQPVGGRPVTLTPTVVDVVDGSLLRWRGTVGPPGLLAAEHSFRLVALDGGATRLHQDEAFHGLLVPLVKRSLQRHTLPAFSAMNEALKRRAERPVSRVRG
jgi:hypothetical protein